LVTCTTEADGVRDKLSATEAAAAAADFLGKVLHVPAILGPTDTPQVESVFSALAALGSSAVIMAGAATGDALTTLDTETPGRVWRTSASDALHAKAIVSDMRTPGPGRTAAVTRVAVVFADNAYGQGLKQAFTTELTAQGGTVAASCPFTPSDNASVAAAAAAASDGSANAEEVLLIAQDADTVAFMAAVAPLSSYDAKGIFLSDPRDYIALLASDSTRFAAVRGTRPGGWSQTETTYRNFATAYGTAYGTDPAIFSNVANTFDAAWLVLYGMAFARGKQFQLTAANVAEGLTHLSGGGTSQQRIAIIADNWSAVTRVLQAGQYVDVRGASGELNFDATTEEATTTFDVWTLTPTKLLSVQYVWQPAS
jgi:branched-chain amino acid transport system substrate-binding protein